MANWFYYNKNGEKIGPISVSALKELTRQGLITRETIIENQNGRSSAAGKVNGLTFPETIPVPVSHPTPPPYMSNPQPTVAPVASTSGNSGLWKTKRNCGIIGTLLIVLGIALSLIGGELNRRNRLLLLDVAIAEEEYNVITSGGRGIRQGVFESDSVEEQTKTMLSNWKIINEYQKKIDDAKKKFNAESYPPDLISFLKGGGIFSFLLGIILQIVGRVIHAERPKEDEAVRFFRFLSKNELCWAIMITILVVVRASQKFGIESGLKAAGVAFFAVLIIIPIFRLTCGSIHPRMGYFGKGIVVVVFYCVPIALIASLESVVNDWSVYGPGEALGTGIFGFFIIFLILFLFIGLPTVGICYLLRIGR